MMFLIEKSKGGAAGECAGSDAELCARRVAGIARASVASSRVLLRIDWMDPVGVDRR
jgi:hypothetical protein